MRALSTPRHWGSLVRIRDTHEASCEYIVNRSRFLYSSSRTHNVACIVSA
jgi:hypothetical protein